MCNLKRFIGRWLYHTYSVLTNPVQLYQYYYVLISSPRKEQTTMLMLHPAARGATV
ncbi:hypothetical protein SK128_011572 [Halocaridina rubra]|uniref:Uncharacterized protein n=1 Tax=Halocaridina rubra TaxID=373956 RepID=A0AAN9A745_HALRR